MIALLRKISLRHLARAPLRSLLVVIGIALGVALYVATEADADSMQRAFADLVARVSGRADLTVEGTGPGVRADLTASVLQVPGVAHAAPSLEVAAQATELGDSLLVLGVDLLGDPYFLPFRDAARVQGMDDPLAFVNDPSALLLSAGFAHRHGLHAGSRIRLLTSNGPRDFHVRGVLADGGGSRALGDQVAVMFLDAAQLAFGRGEFADRIEVALAPGANLDAVRLRLQRRLGDGPRVGRPERIGTRLRLLARPLHAALWTAAFLALLVGAFLVYNAVGVAVAQRRSELGLLRALGVQRRQATALFCAEACLLALPGSALGLVLGRFIAGYFTASTLESIDLLYASVPQLVPRVSGVLALEATAAAVLMAAAAAFWPAHRGAALQPALVLRGTSGSAPARPRLLAMLLGGGVLIALGRLQLLAGSLIGGAVAMTLTVLGAALATPAGVVALRRLLRRPVAAALGVPGRLGLDYVERSLGRSAVNVLALMVAVGMSVSMGGWLSSLERSIARWAQQVGTADLTVTQGSPLLDRRHVPLAAGAPQRVEQVPGVAAVQRFRMVDQRVAGIELKLVATETRTFIEHSERRGRGWRVLQGAPLQAGELTDRPRILLSENAASLLHVHAGDTLLLPTPSGDLRLQVRAVIVDYSSERGAAFIDRSVFRRYWQDDAVDGVFVYLQPGTQPDTMAARIRAALGDAGPGGTVFVTQTSAVERHIVASVRRTFAYSHAMELMTLVIALMGVIGTMAAAIIDRRAEIGVLRAIGATASQVGTSIVVEAAFLGLCAAVAGMLLSVVEVEIFFHTMLVVQTGWHLDFAFPWRTAARTCGLVVLTSALAGALPAWRAARKERLTAFVGQ